PKGSTVLDVGGGVGFYADWLAHEGHVVRLIDPVPEHVEEARGAAGPEERFAVELGDARSLPAEDGSVDVVLLLGPLYHLVERGDRVQALREARRVVREGGLVFAAAISRYAPALDGVCKGWIAKAESVSAVAETTGSGAG